MHTDLYQRPGFALHCKPEVAELAVASVGRGQPVLQAAAVDGPQRPHTLARRKQVFLTAALVADPAHRAVIEGTAVGGETHGWSAHSPALGQHCWAGAAQGTGRAGSSSGVGEQDWAAGLQGALTV